MGWALIFLFGGLAATLGDLNHVRWGVLAYPGGGQPLWVMGLMGSASVGMVAAHRGLPVREAPLAWGAVLPPATAFFAFYFLTGPLAPHPIALTTILAVAFLARSRGEPATVWLSPLGAAIGGPLFEAALSSTGAFSYLCPRTFSVPTWLPFLYLHAGLAARAIARAL
ncbi:MAG: hypothetical protein ACOZNI_04855 [Myxococcota bacterium]